MSDDDHEISYIEDTGQVKFHLRRPVHLYVPSALQDSGDYDPLVETSPPAQDLELEWVYGYRGRDVRNNIQEAYYDNIVYFAASVAVVYDTKEFTQRFYTQHTDDIKSLSVHPDYKTIATGQCKGVDDEEDAAHIRIWNAETLETLHILGTGLLQRSVGCLAFSRFDEGVYLAAVDESPEPKLAVWEWKDENLVGEAKCSGDQVLAMRFSYEDDQRVVTVGKNNITFWSMKDGGLKKRTGIFGNHPKPKYVTAICSTPAGNVISGDSNGNVIIWKKEGNEIEKVIPNVHEGSIFNIYTSANGGYTTVGKDPCIKQWCPDFEELEVHLKLPESYGGCRVVVEFQHIMVVGTVNNIMAMGDEKIDFSIITQGPHDEVWGLASHPSEEKVLAGALDGLLQEYNASDNKTLWTHKFENGVQSCCYSPGGEVIVVGFANGEWKVLDYETKEVLFEGEDGGEALQVVRFSPDGSLLALGSRDNNVYVFEVGGEFKEFTKRGACTGHSSFIRSFDFSSDGQFLQTNSGDYELLFWKLEDCSQEPDSSELKDVEWATRTCLLSFANFGVWPKGVDGTDLNSVSGAHSKPLVVTADDFGKVKLFGSDTHYAYTANKIYPGHSSHVTNAVFSNEDSRVFSIGGNDRSLLQWKVKDEE